MDNIYQHFRHEERPFIDQIVDLARRADLSYDLQLTHFLNPREQHIAGSIVGQWPDLSVQTWGGFPEAERRRLLIIPPYREIQKSDFELSQLQIDYPIQFATLSHGSILGSLMGAGIKRERFGDIVTDGSRWQFATDAHLAPYLIREVSRIGRHSVTLRPINDRQAIRSAGAGKNETIIVSSLRLDSILARALNRSRNQAKDLIQNGRVRLNWMDVDRPDLECGQDDLISIRGFGRIRIEGIQGRTKKDNLILQIKQISSRHEE